MSDAKPIIANPKHLHLFIDIETTDTVATAFPWQIGVLGVIENRVTGSLQNVIAEEWLIRVNNELLAGLPEGRDCEFLGFTASCETLNWIANKSSEATRAAWGSATSPTQGSVPRLWIADAINDVIRTVEETARELLHDEWQSSDISAYTWGQFDVPILKHALSRVDATSDLPWHYRNEIDLRSVCGFYGLKERPDTSSHTALADAVALFELWRRLRLNYSGVTLIQPSLDIHERGE